MHPILYVCEATSMVFFLKFSFSSRLRQWLSKLKEKRSRSSALSNLYRQEGNQFYREVLEPRDLAADYYTKAIYAAPKNSIELALAHANRAACSQYRLNGKHIPEVLSTKPIFYPPIKIF